jgi:lipopolysaccharide transport system ATP-binding protein
MLSFRDTGRTILFVSHNLSAVEMMCQRVVWLDHGTVRMHGPTAEVVRAYLDAVDATLIEHASAVPAGEALGLDEVTLLNDNGQLCTDFEYGEPLRVRLRCLARTAVEGVSCTITVRGDYAPLFSARTQTFPAWNAGPHEIECAFESLPLLPGLYRVEVLLAHAATDSWALPQSVAAFRVRTDLSQFGSSSPVGATKSRGGFLAVPYDWRVRSNEGDQELPGLRVPEKLVRR